MSAHFGRRRAATDNHLSTLGRVALLWRVWLTAGHVRFLLSRRPLHEVVAALGQPAANDRKPTALLSRAVTRGLRIGRWQPRCLIRSLVLYRLLRAQGDAPELIIGLPHRPTSSDAHAWVEIGGRDVGPAPGSAGYQELTRYPRACKPTAQPVP